MYVIESSVQVNIVAFSTDRTPAGELGGPELGQPWVVSATRDEMLSHFEGWGPQVTELLSVRTKHVLSTIIKANPFIEYHPPK